MKHAIEDQIADYLNGHLTFDEAQYFERQLAEDAQLREMVAFERRVQSHIANSEPVSAATGPRFASFATQLDHGYSNRLNLSWLNWGLPAALALALGVFGILQPSQTGPGSFTTLSDVPPTVDQPTLRLISNNPLNRQEVDALLQEYGLVLIKEHHGLSSYDVRPIKEASLDELANRLAGDPRIRFANVQEGR